MEGEGWVFLAPSRVRKPSEVLSPLRTETPTGKKPEGLSIMTALVYSSSAVGPARIAVTDCGWRERGIGANYCCCGGGGK